MCSYFVVMMFMCVLCACVFVCGLDCLVMCARVCVFVCGCSCMRLLMLLLSCLVACLCWRVVDVVFVVMVLWCVCLLG